MTDTDPVSQARAQSLPALITRIASEMRPNESGYSIIGRGDQAALKRFQHGLPNSGAYWRVVVRILESAGWAPRYDEQHARWGHVLAMIARLSNFHRPRGRRLGQALASPNEREGGLNELRLLRLLRSDGEALFDAVRQVSHWIRSKGAHVDLTGLAWLLLTSDPDKVESVRREIARDYYTAQYKAEQGVRS